MRNDPSCKFFTKHLKENEEDSFSEIKSWRFFWVQKSWEYTLLEEQTWFLQSIEKFARGKRSYFSYFYSQESDIRSVALKFESPRNGTVVGIWVMPRLRCCDFPSNQPSYIL